MNPARRSWDWDTLFTRPWIPGRNFCDLWPPDSPRQQIWKNGTTCPSWLRSSSVEEFNRRGKTEIMPNVDFYSAPVYFMMGIPKDLFTPIFAISRIAGWCSHIIEEKFGEAQEKPMLYRPQAEYVGNYCGLMGCEYSPLPER